jgi:hypothetical protein
LLNDQVGLYEQWHGNGIWNRKRNAILIATWNVRLMLQPGKMVEIADEERQFEINILAIQETRWRGHGRTDKQDYSVFHSGPNSRTGQCWTGFIIHA